MSNYINITTKFIFLLGNQIGPIKEALFLGTDIGNATQKDCIYRRGSDRDSCPDPDVKLIMYTKNEDVIKKSIVDIFRSDWLRTSSWNSSKSNVVLIHGYAGGDDTLPIVVLRDGKIIIKKTSLVTLINIFIIFSVYYD